MNKIFTIFSVAILLTSCSMWNYQGDAKLNKNNVDLVERRVVNDVTDNVRSVVSSSSAISNATTKATNSGK